MKAVSDISATPSRALESNSLGQFVWQLVGPAAAKRLEFGYKSGKAQCIEMVVKP
jgi:hypothetical protein